MPDGPTFEETLLVTPPGWPAGRSLAAVRTAADAARALGLSTGPVHAELRSLRRPGGPAMLELAPTVHRRPVLARPEFPGGASLEEIVLANALGQARSPPPAGPDSAVRRVHAPGAAARRPARGRGPGRSPGRARRHRADHHDPARPAGPPAPGRGPLPGVHLRFEATPRRTSSRRSPPASGRLRVIISDGRPRCRAIIVSIARPPERKNRTSSAAASSRKTMLRIVV